MFKCLGLTRIKIVVFPSFLIGGFEGATGYNCRRQWFDTIARTQHDRRLEEDYALLQGVGIRAVRESIRWPLIDSFHGWNLQPLERVLNVARRHSITVIHDLFHFGYPETLNVLSPEFANRYTEYCYRIAQYVSVHTDGPCYFTPMNEPSYFAWAAGEVGLFAPHLSQQGGELKRALVSAAIKGINAIWAACPSAHIINVDPLCRVVCGTDDSFQWRVDEFNTTSVFEAWDMIAGLKCPELGGTRRHLGIVGVNYYWTNQWDIRSPDVPLADNDPRRWRLSKMIEQVWKRYGAEILITETSHVGERRGPWLNELEYEAALICSTGIPLRGVCWYPILEMPDWHVEDGWQRMGLWDLDWQRGTMNRIPCNEILDTFRRSQERLGSVQSQECRSCA
jgi:hypothetical protein